jgi:hypothetical protein
MASITMNNHDDHTETVESLQIKNQLLLELLDSRQKTMDILMRERDDALERLRQINAMLERIETDAVMSYDPALTEEGGDV